MKCPRLITRRRLKWACVPFLAFVVVVAAAMGCAVWSPVRGGSTIFGYMSTSDNKLPWALREYDSKNIAGYEWAGFGVSFHRILPARSQDAGGRAGTRPLDTNVGRAGFPFRCMRWTVAQWHGIPAPPLWAGGIELKPRPGRLPFSRRIPLMPEPVGMVLNVLIVSAAIVLVRVGLRRAIVYRRRRKGLCVKCGYPIEASAPRCPECGSAYPVSAVQSRA